MNTGSVSKVCLGTAQFGLNYGIANKDGRVGREQVRAILNRAHQAGIGLLDTAHSYGESESLIGEFMSESGKTFGIISKTPHFDDNIAPQAEKYFLKTLENLGQRKIYAYLVHRFSDMVTDKERLWKSLKGLKRDGLTGKIGVSLYSPQELDYLLDNGFDPDIVEVPYNVFDQRFKARFPELKKRGIEVYARSVFLQGLFFVSDNVINKDFRGAKGALGKLRSISKESSLQVHSLCLCFALLDPLITKVVIGVDSLKHLEENLKSLESAGRIKEFYGLLEQLAFHNEDIIMPYRWKR